MRIQTYVELVIELISGEDRILTFKSDIRYPVGQFLLLSVDFLSVRLSVCLIVFLSVLVKTVECLSIIYMDSFFMLSIIIAVILYLYICFLMFK